MGRIWGARLTARNTKRRAALSRASSHGTTTRRKPRAIPALRAQDWQTVDVPSVQGEQR